jgi:HEAT repeat protein
MVNRHMHQEQQSHQYMPPPDSTSTLSYHPHQESTCVALALLLSPDTEYATRARAVRRLARQGPAVLPLFLVTLSNTPEITSPEWPWWPPQYEHCGRLLLHLCQKAHLRLDEVLQHPALPSPAGPVLWVCVIEAANLLPDADYEALLRKGLESPWMTVRYAAAMALATRASRTALTPTTIELLKVHQQDREDFPIRLTASYALLTSGESTGIEMLIQFLDLTLSEEVRRAASFILATEIALPLSAAQQEQLAYQLLCALRDPNTEIALLAARALRHVTLPSTLHALRCMLNECDSLIQQHVLAALEEMARRPPLRTLMIQQALPACIVPFLRADNAELRRQASYTLVAIGGEFATAVLGTAILTHNHPGYIEALESLRLLPDALRTPTRAKITRWLLLSLDQPIEDVQITVLNSLIYLVWRARTHGQKRTWQALSADVWDYESISTLLYNSSPVVRQRTVELLGVLEGSHPQASHLYTQMRGLLHADPDSGVRCSVATMYGEIMAQWAIPDLIQALLDPDEYVAEKAFTALERLVSFNTPVIMYVARELSHYSTVNNIQRGMLAQHAHAAVRKWNQSEGGKKYLHST